MVLIRTLADMRRVIGRRAVARAGTAWVAVGLVLAVLTAGGTLALGLVGYPHPGAGADVLAATFAVWFLGRAAQAALTGDAALPPETFRLLPIPRRRLAAALLAAGLLDPTLVLLAVAFAGLVGVGVRGGAAAAVVSVVALVLLVLLAGVVGVLAAAVLAPGSRRGRDVGTLLGAVVLSIAAACGTLLPSLLSTLAARHAPSFATAVRVLPSGWGPTAVDAARRGEWALVAAGLGGLVVLIAAGVAVWPWLLVRRLDGTAAPRARHGHTGGRSLLPRTPLGAVAGKELRLWVRDPVRFTFLLIAAIVGTLVAAVPILTADTTRLLPFAGAMSIVIAGACATNLYGNDGSALWLTVMTPGAPRPDVRGRQLAVLLVTGPYAVVLTVALTAVSGQHWAWVWVLGIVPALVGGAAGLAAYGSLVSPQPLDETGNPTPQWSLKVHVALLVMLLPVVPSVLLLAFGAAGHDAALRWAAVPVGVVVGVVLCAWLGRLAVGRLAAGEVTLLGRLKGT